MTQAQKTILLVEDDERLAALIKEYLEQQGYNILLEYRGDKALDRIKKESPHMVILDLMLPGKDGLSVLKEARPDFAAPVLILTAREDDTDQIVGLELGADDYVQKPVDPGVLLARIRALFRRIDHFSENSDQDSSEKEILKFGELEIHTNSRYVTLFNQPMELSTLEFDLLALLASEPGTVMDRDRLCQTVRGIEYDGLDRSIDVAISRLRKKLEDNPDKPFRIKTIWGSGYLFAQDAWEKSAWQKEVSVKDAWGKDAWGKGSQKKFVLE